jgi:outer membrane protein assembly factor BamB
MFRKPVIVSFTLLTLVLAVASGRVSADENWPQFRGAQSTGVVDGGANLPSTWSTTENVEWRTDIDGRGWSSPVVWEKQIFLTSVVNTGESEEPKKGLYFGGNRTKPPTSEHQWIVQSLDLETGSVNWTKTLNQGIPKTPIHLKNSFASETPVTDGEHLYVVFAGLGLYCLDLKGNEVWKRELEPLKTRYGWGSAASPVLHGDRLYYVNDNDEQSYLVALDKRTGDVVWKVDRDEKSNWATPYVWENDKRTEIVVPATGRVVSYDLDGKELWSLKGMSSITIAMPYEYDGLLYVTSGYVGDSSRPMYAIKPGAEGDISLDGDETSNESIVWSLPDSAPYNPTTIAHDGVLYVVYDRGLLGAFDAKDGSEVYKRQRLPKGAFTSSPWIYDGKLFMLNEDGKTHVVKAGREYELLGTNELADDDMGMATPAIVGDRLLIRTAARIYCIKK